MADALCGPSNALQNFHKHNTTDRTLQQDRLSARHSPSQGFRSSPGPGAGLLDPEFEAFQAGQPPLQRPEAAGFSQVPFRNALPPQQSSQAAAAGWANDFQHLNLPGPQQAHYPRYNFAMQPEPESGWQNEFSKQQSQPAGRPHSQHANYNVPFERLSTLAPMTQSFQPMQLVPIRIMREQQEQTVAQKAEALDEEAFARAFDEAAQAEFALRQGLALEQSQEDGQEVLVNESAERLLDSDSGKGQVRLGADLIHDPRSEEKPQQQDDPDALARTAGQLLDSVKSNQSAKFQNSQFLSLMRQLRDREVTVEGDQIVGVPPESRKSMEEVEKSLRAIARRLSLLDFARVEPLLARRSRSFAEADPLTEQLLLGSFTRTLTRVSAALETLTRKHPRLLQRSAPFGLQIGVEVFALADNPLLAQYPALQALVLSFRAQFSALGIGPGMMRRATYAMWKADLREVEDEDEDPAAGEEFLRDWLVSWLAQTPVLVQTHTSLDEAAFQENFLLPSQLEALLGKEVYPGASAVSGSLVETPHVQMEHFNRVRDILGENILAAMRCVWDDAMKELEPDVSLDQFTRLVEKFAAARHKPGVAAREAPKGRDGDKAN